ncbi:MAG: aminomethyl-transferring glycine dehydrogenase subunit GcvPB [Bacteroidota bacterium]
MKGSLLSFEKSSPGKRAWILPHSEVPPTDPEASLHPGLLRKTPLGLPELAEVDIVRHYTNLSNRNFGVDNGFYPLGSCTMKYNPKINEDLTVLSGVKNHHPLWPENLSQGALRLLYDLEQALIEITGMDHFTLQPAAGAHGELTALLIIKAYLHHREETHRTKVLVPASAHGTNPASAAMAGFDILTVKCDSQGLVDLEHLQSLIGPDVAALMLTNPNTLGLFEKEIKTIADLVHRNGSLLYYDGANLNAIMGLVRPGDMGFDLVHLNLHKTFAAPHGGGGPGAGPVGVKKFLADYLPTPVLRCQSGVFAWNYDRPLSIGKVLGFYGNFSVLFKALAYIKALGGEGLAQVSQDAILNANYLRVGLDGSLQIPYNRPCMHEFVASAVNLKEYGIKALDIAKRLIDFGYHPPTIYFPLIVDEALMIEPTETESQATLNDFLESLLQIVDEAKNSPEQLTSAPHLTPVSRVDEASAARMPRLVWSPQSSKS